MRVAAGHDRLPGLEPRPERLAELERELGGYLEVREAADPAGAEQRARPLLAVDQRHRDDRAGIDPFVGPQLQVRVHRRAGADRAAAPDHAVLVDLGALLNRVAVGDRAIAQRRLLADVDVFPQDAAADDRAALDDRAIPAPRGPGARRPRRDPHVAAEHDRTLDLRVRLDPRTLAGVHAGRDLSA